MLAELLCVCSTAGRERAKSQRTMADLKDSRQKSEGCDAENGRWRDILDARRH